MGLTERSHPRQGGIGFWGLVRDLALGASMLTSSLLSVALALNHLTQPVALFLASILLLAGIAQRLRAARRCQDRAYRAHPAILRLIGVEAAVARMWILTGVSLGVLAALAPNPVLLAAAGTAVTCFIFLKGIGSAGRSAEAEVSRDLSKGSAAEKCWRVQRWANWAASARLVPGTRCFHGLATYVVPAGQIGPLHAAALTAVGLCCLAYVSLGVAAGIGGIAAIGGHGPGDRGGGPRRAAPLPSPPPAVEVEQPPGDFPTYAASCPELPDPLKIGHGLGELFQHDGAAKAGCGSRARRVRGTGTWVAPGLCSDLDERRSLAVAAPGEAAAILYGAAAGFAWQAALEGDLLGAEAARPAGGDVDVIETREGNYVFARQSASIGPGSENLRWCWEASGRARPFVRLAPSLAWLWLELVRQRASWSWPLGNRDDSDSPVVFVDAATGEPIATGGCDRVGACRLHVEGEVWPSAGTAFVSLFEFSPYMPPSPSG